MATQTRQLVDLLSAEGHNVHVVQTNSAYSPAWIKKIRGARAIFRLLPYFRKVWQLAGKVNVIHLMANSGWSWQLFSAPVIWIAWIRKTPLIVNYRGGEAPQYFSRSMPWIRPTMKRAVKIVVPSGYLEKVFGEYGFQCEVIPNIVNLERFMPNPAASYKTNSRFTLIVTRNLEPIYGLPTAIKALALAADHIPSIEVLIAGTGPEKERLKNLSKRLGVDDKVHFVGRLGPGEIEKFYQGADVMLNPTTVDNMPNSILEALASCVPVISTNIGGVPYMVEHNNTALLVPVNDEEEMARQILRLYKDDKLREKLIVNGLQEVAQYSWLSVKPLWLSAYNSVQHKLRIN
ncbi:MAG: glycosyl transferase family 1 [Cellvibrionales bacterium]|nr:MAG: glycosyl transferase family 1 [Cellvibrionales bacterium]